MTKASTKRKNNKDLQVEKEMIHILRLRIIPRTEGNKKDSAKVTIPTLYLGMSRMAPIGEFEDHLIERKITNTFDKDDKNFIRNSFNFIFPSETNQDKIISHSFLGSKKRSYLPDFSYNSFTISLGQDSLSSIITALASFNWLKRILGSNYQGGILVIDEVDAGFHPKAQEKLIGLLIKKARDLELQIILTSHSLTVLKAIFDSSDHPGDKQDKVIYLQDSQYPRLMNNPTYTKVKEDMLLLPDKEKNNEIKVYFEDDEALFFFLKILDYIKTTNSKDILEVNLKLIPLHVGCDTLLNLYKGDDYFQRVVIIPDNDVFSSGSNRNIISQQKSICPLPGNTNFDNSTPKTDRSPERILYNFIQEKINFPDTSLFWHSMPEKYTTDYVRANILSDPMNKNWEIMKQRFNQNKDFISECKLIQKWCDENSNSIKRFIEDLTNAIKYCLALI